MFYIASNFRLQYIAELITELWNLSIVTTRAFHGCIPVEVEAETTVMRHQGLGDRPWLQQQQRGQRLPCK